MKPAGIWDHGEAGVNRRHSAAEAFMPDRRDQPLKAFIGTRVA
jgi:hypothetical protein